MDQPTREAAHKGDLAYFEKLGDGIRPTAKDEDGRSLLHVACTSGNVELVRFVAEKGGKACINEQDEEVSDLHASVHACLTTPWRDLMHAALRPRRDGRPSCLQ